MTRNPNTITRVGNVIWLHLKGGAKALIDAEDYDKVRPYRWCEQRYKNHDVSYAVSTAGGLHRLILGVTDRDIFVDHKNGNGLDNRKENLRRATRAQNSANKRQQRRAKWPYKGIKQLTNGRWTANVTLGTFDTPEDAARAYNSAASSIFGEFACLNEVPNA